MFIYIRGCTTVRARMGEDPEGFRPGEGSGWMEGKLGRKIQKKKFTNFEFFNENPLGMSLFLSELDRTLHRSDPRSG